MKKLLLFNVLMLAAMALAAQSVDDVMRISDIEGGKLYFIKPLEFNVASQPAATMEADFTYAYQAGKDNSVVMNFTVVTKSPMVKLDSLVIGPATAKTAKVDSFERFYNELVKGKWRNRYSTNIQYPDFMQWIKGYGQLTATLYADGKQYTLSLPKSSEKALKVVYESLLVDDSFHK